MPTPVLNSPAAKVKSPVEYVRPEVAEYMPRWVTIRACLDGEHAVKALRFDVLPMPNAQDQSAENAARYNAYLGRAVWYNVTARTHTGLCGYVFSKSPVVELPPALKVLEDNVDGTGVTLDQQSKKALGYVLAYGRAGLLVDYPTTATPDAEDDPAATITTRAQQDAGNVAPTIVLYTPDQITNWRVEAVGAKKLLIMLVLKESCLRVEPDSEDEFGLQDWTQYRVLTLENGTVQGRIFDQSGNPNEFRENVDLAYSPQDANGKPLTEIPFCFIGAVNNDDSVDPPPMLDLVNLNLAHFRNSADYEEACFMLGQPTPWVSGVTEGWVQDVWKGTLGLGSRAVIPLPAGGQAGLLQVQPNTLPMEAMTHKEAQMVALGAKLVQTPDVQKTATQSNMDQASEVSVLTAAANNVFQAYTMALGYASTFAGADGASISYDLSEPLTQDVLDALQAQALIALWQGGLITFEEARFTLRRSGLAYLPDDQAREATASEGLPMNNQPPQPGTGNPAPPKPGDPPAPAPKPKPGGDPKPAPAPGK